MLFEACNLCDATHGLVAKFHQNLGVERQEDVDSRAEFDESHVLFNAHFVARFNVSDYAARNGTGNLTHKHIAAAACANHHSGALVFGARLGQVCREESA